MYEEDYTDPPRDEDHFWEMVFDNYEHARHILADYYLEKEEEAKKGTLRRNEDGSHSLEAMNIIAYRPNTRGFDLREYCYELGLEKLAEVYDLMQARKLTPEFYQAWGVLQFCHGYIVTHVFQNSNDMAQYNGAAKNAAEQSVAAQRVWVARQLKRLMTLPTGERGLYRDRAEEAIETLVKEFIAHGGSGDRFPADWFSKILDESGKLKSTYRRRQIYGIILNKLAENEDEETPPLFPDP